MLTRWGVVRAVDVGSPPLNTLALRRRVESGEVPGPAIMLASGTFVPVGGSPYYVLPLRLPELPDSAQAGILVDRLLDLPGIDGVKLFTGSWAARDSIVVMPTEVVRAAVEAAHRGAGRSSRIPRTARARAPQSTGAWTCSLTPFRPAPTGIARSPAACARRTWR